MVPARGIVIGVSGPNLVIKLESGRVIKMSKAYGLAVGKPVIIAYDFTMNKAKCILHDEGHALFIESKATKPEPIVEQDETDDIYHEDGFWDLWDSGILGLSEPDSGEFWDSDSGILGLSVQSFGGSDSQDPQE